MYIVRKEIPMHRISVLLVLATYKEHLTFKKKHTHSVLIYNLNSDTASRYIFKIDIGINLRILLLA